MGAERFIRRALRRLRWAVIGLLLLLTLVQGGQGRVGLPVWMLVLLFGAYNLLLERLSSDLPWSRFVSRRSILDLLVGSVLYLLGPEPGGALFVIFLLAVACAAVSMTLKGTLLYTGSSALLVSLFDLTFARNWPGTYFHQLGARLTVLVLVGSGIAILTRRLALEQEASRSLRYEAERLAELERVREKFISSISHELRTPLTAARAALGLLEATSLKRLGPEERQLLDNARRNVERLHLRIADLLAFNQLRSGIFRLELEPLDVRAIVKSAVSLVEPLTEQKHQLVEVDLPDPLPIEGDETRLEQVIVNLLANAHQHTPPRTCILLTGRTTPDEVCLTVRDNGPGISPDELAAIFQRFYRTATAGEGSGLGLAIAREIVELHGGRLWAESQLGEGSAFHLALPRSPERQETANFDET